MVADRPGQRTDALSDIPVLIVLQEQRNPAGWLETRLQKPNRVRISGGLQNQLRPCPEAGASLYCYERRFVAKTNGQGLTADEYLGPDGLIGRYGYRRPT